MTTEQQERLNGYLDGFRDVNLQGFVPIGAVVVDDDARTSVTAVLKRAAATIVVADENRLPDSWIKEMVEGLSKGRMVALDLHAVPHKCADVLLSLTDGFLDVRLAGDAERTVLNPVPATAKVLCVVNAAGYDELSKFDICSSACRLVSHKKTPTR